MKKIIVLLPFLFAMLVATAQEKQAFTSDFSITTLSQQLQLSPDQQTEVERILLRQQSQRAQLAGISKENTTIYQQKSEAITKGNIADINMVLNKAQKKQFRMLLNQRVRQANAHKKQNNIN